MNEPTFKLNVNFISLAVECLVCASVSQSVAEVLLHTRGFEILLSLLSLGVIVPRGSKRTALWPHVYMYICRSYL